MIRLLIIFAVVLIVWQLLKMLSNQARILSRQSTIDEARTIGLDEAGQYIQNPILSEDYVQERGISLQILGSLIERGDIPAYQWRQYIYVENRELINF
ncbi:MAG: hypothetical protein HRU38_05785 [Saccharospirillaceae bacterium]|nr:hypothetical protein [Pseudomonadales bacterium]NRB78167.1 hypothetical protein [Saccharospirillaceae bacterium]